jgi:hypothetical protein
MCWLCARTHSSVASIHNGSAIQATDQRMVTRALAMGVAGSAIAMCASTLECKIQGRAVLCCVCTDTNSQPLLLQRCRMHVRAV